MPTGDLQLSVSTQRVPSQYGVDQHYPLSRRNSDSSQEHTVLVYYWMHSVRSELLAVLHFNPIIIPSMLLHSSAFDLIVV